MYLARQMTEALSQEIGRQFGAKHHTTVMHSISKIDKLKRSGQGPEPDSDEADETLNG